MSDYIDRQAAIDALAKHEKSKGHNYTLFVDIVSECAEIIRDLPSAEVEPVKRGKWIRERRPCIFSQTGSADWLTCSVCGERFSTTEVNKEKYCRNCGAKMEPFSASPENGQEVEDNG